MIKEMAAVFQEEQDSKHTVYVQSFDETENDVKVFTHQIVGHGY